MKLKYILIIILVLGLGWFLISKMPKPGEENLGNTVPERPQPIVAEDFEGEADPERMTLGMTEWNWISVTYSDGTTIVPRTPGKFALTFLPDGTFGASTDCNGIGGKYEVNQNLITFKEIMSTLMYCEGSQEEDFRRVLEQADSFFFTSKGELVLDLKFDSGSAIFR